MENEYPLDESEFLDILFADNNLVDSLGRRKKAWAFGSLEGLRSVIVAVPLFRRHARIIQLNIRTHFASTEDSEHRHSSTDIAIELLSTCFHIVKLTIKAAYRVNLTKIASSFPFLEILDCGGLSQFDGSLQELDRLQRLRMRVSLREGVRHWLPLQSTGTLTELNLNYGPFRLDTDCFSEMAAFINLKSLEIAPLLPTVCDILIHSPIKLDTFKVRIDPLRAPIDKVLDMLRADCFCNLKQVAFVDWSDEFPLDATQLAAERFWSLALDSFTSLLSSVEKVLLNLPVCLEYCAYFSRMRNLKLLDWDASAECFPAGLDSMDSEEEHKEKVEKALESAFSEFTEKPRFSVTLSRSQW